MGTAGRSSKRDGQGRAPRSAWAAGDVAGSFLLVEELGRGAIASVWRASRLSPGGTSEWVALKLPARAESEPILRREARCLGRLHHPGIVQLSEVQLDPLALVLELVEGRSLREELRRRGRLPVHRALDIVRQVSAAISCAHEAGVVHGDLKPENILLVRGEVCKVFDFGLVDAQADPGAASEGPLQLSLASETTGVSGTPAYMAPEQRRAGRVDARADVYAIGLLIFELLTGRGPEGYEAPTDVCSGVPAAVDEIFRRCYAPYDRRYPSAVELARALTKAGFEAPSLGRDPGEHRLVASGAGGRAGRVSGVSFGADPQLAVPLGPGVERLRAVLTGLIYALVAVTGILAAKAWWLVDGVSR